METITKIKSIQKITHDVFQIKAERPKNIEFTPGQATEISINKDGWQTEKRPFTFTSLPDDNYLEFTIKSYPDHNGVTNEIAKLKAGDELLLHDVFGDIHYKGEGIFMAGGAGITPFISIFRYLDSTNQLGKNKLIFANKRKADIIMEHEFKRMLTENFINVLSDEKAQGYEHGFITEDLLKKHSPLIAKHYYICGPPPMMDAVEKILHALKVPEGTIVKEGF